MTSQHSAKFDAATQAQVISADPLRSTWLSANAGSGKTRVLTNRVARLLLQAVPPERILCLTYTKAAAAEMQNRLFETLGEWATMGDGPLLAALSKLGVAEHELGLETLAHARTLFARAVEAPGGLKIQTIHSFCASVLRRFPVEAQISPAFEEMDERDQSDLTAMILEEMAQDITHGGQATLDIIAPFLSDLDGQEAARAVVSHRDHFETPSSEAELRAYFGIGNLTEDGLLAQVFTGDEVDLCDKLEKLLDANNSRQAKSKRILKSYDWSRHSLSSLAELEAIFVNGSGAKNAPDAAKGDSLFNAQVRASMGEDFPALCAFMERLAEARPKRRALRVLEKSHALHQFAPDFLARYDRAKERRAWLDFDDLIRLTNRLLTETSLAQWVLFRLDGGIDHMLVDEAQDTSPAQWQIIAKLAEEFAAGQSARDGLTRTIFVVGDKKQSIYSFQGADPEGFDRMRDAFDARLAAVRSDLQKNVLKYSFRSAPAILELVDRVAADQGHAGLGQDVEHKAYFEDLPGRVDIWPAIESSAPPEVPAWDDPVDMIHDSHHSAVLANRIANFIRATIDNRHVIRTGNHSPRVVQPRDFLILLRSRSALFHQIIRALKEKNLPIMGADRLRISAELAVRDLTALMSFLATPEDDLSLAAYLRSPLGGMSEAELFDLAHNRKTTLWNVLRNQRDRFPDVVTTLENLRNMADFQRPYEILEYLLTKKGGRRAFIARLGHEAEDGIDGLLHQAMSYERHDVPSVAGFAAWLRRGDVMIKRDMTGDDNQIRVMSIHGAKGLEAPIVILPDTAQKKDAGHRGINALKPEDGPLFWASASEDLPQELRPAYDRRKAAQTEEENRLLYVAMTRAETWLIIAAAGQLSAKTGEKRVWYDQIRTSAQALPQTRPHMFWDEAGLRLENGDWSMTEPAQASPDTVVMQGNDIAAALSGWVKATPEPKAKDKPALTPSDLAAEAAQPMDGTDRSAAWHDAEAAKLRGRRLHALLEHLPSVTPAAWGETAAFILAAEGECSSQEEVDLLQTAQKVLTDPALVHLFKGDALAEVPLTAYSEILGRQIYGVIDRLIVTDTTVLAVDFKSNHTVPDTVDHVSDAYMRQMAAYREMLRALYPSRTVEVAILWTNAPSLMHLPDDLLVTALRRAAETVEGS